jgi:hypothetical protein
VNKTNRRTKFQIYWYYDSTCFGQPFRPSSGVLSLHRHWYIVCSFDDRLQPGSKRFITSIHSVFCLTTGSKPPPKWFLHIVRSSQLHKMYQSRCTAKKSWWWAERLPETCRVVIPIKLEFSASVGFTHKEESITMHGHKIVKLIM